MINKNGVEARIMTYGEIVLSLKVPDRNGKLGDIVPGYDNLEGYVKNNGPYFGAIIGRYGNRSDRFKNRSAGSTTDFGKGYDHNRVLNRSGAALTLAARMYDQGSGRVVEVLTTEPELQFTSAIFSMAATAEKACASIQSYGLCLETQHFPDSPNKPSFPSTVLKRGTKYASTTVYRFSEK